MDVCLSVISQEHQVLNTWKNLLALVAVMMSLRNKHWEPKLHCEALSVLTFKGYLFWWNKSVKYINEEIWAWRTCYLSSLDGNRVWRTWLPTTKSWTNVIPSLYLHCVKIWSNLVKNEGSYASWNQKFYMFCPVNLVGMIKTFTISYFSSVKMLTCLTTIKSPKCVLCPVGSVIKSMWKMWRITVVCCQDGMY